MEGLGSRWKVSEAVVALTAQPRHSNYNNGTAITTMALRSLDGAPLHAHAHHHYVYHQELCARSTVHHAHHALTTPATAALCELRA